MNSPSSSSAVVFQQRRTEMSANRSLRQNKLHRTRENSRLWLAIIALALLSFPLGLTDVVRVTDENIPKYRQVNYDAMRQMIHEKKQSGMEAMERGTESMLCAD